MMSQEQNKRVLTLRERITKVLLASGAATGGLFVSTPVVDHVEQLINQISDEERASCLKTCEVIKGRQEPKV